MVTAKTALLRAQRRWADAHGVRYDAHGCVRELDDNLRAPLDGAALAEFQRGSELTPGTARPARLHSLCSSAALVVNVFGYWRGRDQTPLLRALGIAGPGGTRLAFEEPLPTGLPGDPPTVDVALYRPDGRCVAVESKFAEWLVAAVARQARRSRTSTSRRARPSGRPPACRAAKRSPRSCKTAASGSSSSTRRSS